jgi:hypothetical protein
MATSAVADIGHPGLPDLKPQGLQRAKVPSPGRIVMFSVGGGPGDEIWPAIVTRVLKPTLLDLTVFPPSALPVFAVNVPEGGAGDHQRRWFWPVIEA